RIMQVRSGSKNQHMATFSFDAVTLTFDEATMMSQRRSGSESHDCDHDFKAVVGCGAVPLERPANKDWGVRAAYFKGPASLKFEIEGPNAACNLPPIELRDLRVHA